MIFIIPFTKILLSKISKLFTCIFKGGISALTVESLYDWYYCPDYCPHYLQKEFVTQIQQKNRLNWTLKGRRSSHLIRRFFWTLRPYLWSAASFKMTFFLAFLAFLAFCWAISRMWVIFITLKTCFTMRVVTTFSSFWCIVIENRVSCDGCCYLVQLITATFSVVFSISPAWLSASSKLLSRKSSCCNVTSWFRKQYHLNLLYFVTKIICCLISVSNVALKSHFTACSFTLM